ncbi:MAG TPA: ribulose-phosphate 3-epimerase [Phycisphaerales bacterium]|nr:ribulose-phosphate 3-epimerase [Phycisphaerales bacterium]
MPPPASSLFNSTLTHPLIAPSILAADFANMAAQCRAVAGALPGNGAGGDLLHLDVMDGHFVPNLTMGPDMCRGLRRACPDAFLDVHLMVEKPAMYVEPFAKAGANNITFHIEVVKGPAVAELVAHIHSLGMTAGIAINPPTPVEAVMPHVHEADLTLVMSVNPGFGGQAFIPEVLSKVRAVKARQTPLQRLEMDGGINLQTARLCREAGCDVLVAGSSIFGHPQSEWPSIIRQLRTG